MLGLLGAAAIRSALGPIVAVESLLVLFAVYGLWTYEAWGWALVGVLYVVNGLYSLYEVATGTSSGLLGVGVAAVVLAYLYRLREYYLSDERPGERPKGKPRGEYRN